MLVARSLEGLKQVESEIRALGSKALVVPTDISSPEGVEALVTKVRERFHRMDILVNNAGIARVGGIEASAFKTDVQDTLQASLFGMIRLTRALLPIQRRCLPPSDT